MTAIENSKMGSNLRSVVSVKVGPLLRNGQLARTYGQLAEVRFSTGQQKFLVIARGLKFSAFVRRRRVLHKLALDLGWDVNSIR